MNQSNTMKLFFSFLNGKFEFHSQHNDAVNRLEELIQKEQSGNYWNKSVVKGMVGQILDTSVLFTAGLINEFEEGFIHTHAHVAPLVMSGNNRKSDTNFEWTVPLFQHHGFHWSEYREMMKLSSVSFMKVRNLMLDNQRNVSFRNQVLALSWYHNVSIAEAMTNNEYSNQITAFDREDWITYVKVAQQ